MPPDLSDFLENLSPSELQALARQFAEMAAARRARGGGHQLPPELKGGPKDALVQRIAGERLRELLLPVAQRGKGQSLRDIAAQYGVTYERVRTLAQALVSDYAEIMGDKKPGKR